MTSNMKCKNYYKMSDNEIAEAIVKISEWLQKYRGYPQTDRAEFALKVAWNAYYAKISEDPLIKEIIEAIT